MGGWTLIRAGQQRVVLAVLLASAGRVVSLDRLIDEIWGERVPQSAPVTVQGYVARLRRLLGAGRDGPLRTRDHGYELAVAADELDAAGFGELAGQGQRALAAGEVEAALARLTEGLELWRGPALADVPESPTVAGWAARLAQARLDAQEARLDALLRLDRHAEVAAEAGELVEAQPLRERLWAQLMLGLYRGGRRAEALDAYQRAYRRLGAELGVEPGPELRELHRAILAGDATVAAPRSAVPAGRIAPAQLPADVAGFAGRQLELKRLDALLSDAGDPHPVLVISTIVGVAGVGKTALAVRWAHQVRDRFPDGQLYVNLRGYEAGAPLRPIDALTRFLTALGVRTDDLPEDVEQAAALYRSLLAGKRMLVLLDNARRPDQVRPLLPGTPGCLALVTSRDRLAGLIARDGAVGLDLQVLTPSETGALLARVLGAGRVAAEPDAAHELAELAGHLPLALRIAAATLLSRPHATIASYVEQLRRDRLAVLEIADDPIGGVRAAFDHSYRALPDSARSLFRLLGLVPGADFTVETAAALAGTPAPTAGRELDRLTGAHLVEQRPTGRYGLHDLLRRYATERADAELSDSERSSALGHLDDYYLRSVDAAAGQAYPETLRLPVPTSGGPSTRFDSHAAALAWLDAERSNLVAAVIHAGRHGAAAAAWRLAEGLRGYLMMHRHTLAWSDVAQAGLAAAELDGDLHGMAAAHLSLAGLSWVLARHEQAIEHYHAGLARARRVGWAEGEAAMLCNLGLVYWTMGRLDEAAEQFQAALAVDERTGRLASRATNLINLGQVYSAQGRLELAARCHNEALDCYRRTGSRSGEATTLAYLGETYHKQGLLDEALDVLNEAAGLLRELGERRAEGETVRLLAAVQRDLGRSTDALHLARTALDRAREVGDDKDEAEALVVEASIRHQLGRREESAAGFERAIGLARRDGYRYTEAEALIGLAAVWLHTGAPDRASEAATAALATARAAGYRLLEGDALTAAAEAALGLGERDRAVDHAEQALAIHTETGQRLGLARAQLVVAEALRPSGE